VGGSAHAGPSNAGKTAPRVSQDFLPAWAESAIKRVTGNRGYGLNTSMPSLDQMHKLLVEYVPEATREKTAHLTDALFCPNTHNAPKVHSSNGIYVVVCEQVVYARCSDSSCECCKPTGEVELVVGSDKWKRPWVKYTEESYTLLEALAKRKPTTQQQGT
jgi:hypothetical protein